MPWLADLVQSSEGSLDVLPVQCLCEFLLHDAADESTSGEEEEEGESKDQRAKKRQVSSLGDPFCYLLSVHPRFDFTGLTNLPLHRDNRNKGSCLDVCKICCWDPKQMNRQPVRCLTTSCGA